jgi:cytochrome b561
MPSIPFLRITAAFATAPAAATLAFVCGGIGGPRQALLVALTSLPLAALAVWMLLGGGRVPATAPGERWSALSRAFHWATAIAILGCSALMYWMQGIDFSGDNQAARAEYRGWLALHKSIGLCVLLIVPLRMAWNLASRRPPLVGVDSAAQRLALSAVHVTLYSLMLAVPVVGWFASMTYGGKTQFFGLFELPMLFGKDDDLVKVFYPAHTWGSWLLLALVGLHAAAAVWHHAVKRDATLVRMLPGS